jgi:hypothetical protein
MAQLCEYETNAKRVIQKFAMGKMQKFNAKVFCVKVGKMQKCKKHSKSRET